jgi:hypothetical protein
MRLTALPRVVGLMLPQKMQIMKASSPEGLAITAASALGRMLRGAPQLAPAAVSAGAVPAARHFMSSSDGRLQLAGLNVLNVLLAQPPSPDIHAPLLSDGPLIARALDLLDTSRLEGSRLEESRRKVLVAAKALLTISLLVPHSPDLLLFACEKSLLTRFMRVGAEAADSDVKEYALQCQATLRAGIVNSVPPILDSVRSTAGLCGILNIVPPRLGATGQTTAGFERQALNAQQCVLGNCFPCMASEQGISVHALHDWAGVYHGKVHAM